MGVHFVVHAEKGRPVGNLVMRMVLRRRVCVLTCNCGQRFKGASHRTALAKHLGHAETKTWSTGAYSVNLL